MRIRFYVAALTGAIFCAGPAAAADEAAAAPDDRWAGARISGAYDYAECAACGHKNELRAERCSRCDYEFPQPSAGMTDADVVFVPGKGYYEEGALLEPGDDKKGYWVTGIILTASGLTACGFAGYYGGDVGGAIAALPCSTAVGVGVGLIIYGLVTRTKPVCAFADGEGCGPCERPAFALRSPEAGGLALRVELTAFSI